MKVFGISDIHVDHKENWSWLKEAVEKGDFKEDILLLVGGKLCPLSQKKM